MRALLGFVSESRWVRHARKSLRGLFPCVPGQSGYNKRLRKLAATMARLIRALARDTSLRAGDVWVVDSTPGLTIEWRRGTAPGASLTTFPSSCPTARKTAPASTRKTCLPKWTSLYSVR